MLFDGPLWSTILKTWTPAILSDPVDPVGRLVFPGRVPPPVVMDDNRGGNQVNPHTDRLQGSDKDFAFGIVAKLIELCFPVARASPDAANPMLFSVRYHSIILSMSEILGEDDKLLPAVARSLGAARQIGPISRAVLLKIFEISS